MFSKNLLYRKFSIPNSLELSFYSTNYILKMEGPLGQNMLNLFSYRNVVDLKIDNNDIFVFKKTKDITKKRLDSFTNLLERTLQGSVHGYLFYLNLIGIGYKGWCSPLNLLKNELVDQCHSFFVMGNEVPEEDSYFLCLKIGYSHQVSILVPKGIFVFCVTSSNICLYGQDYLQLTAFAAFVKQIRLPENYKGKGIRLRDDIILLKEGKKK